ncbi:hypothetical protein EMIT036CA2_30365 [Chryseobacterium sp. IT-36CA2]
MKSSLNKLCHAEVAFNKFAIRKGETRQISVFKITVSENAVFILAFF